MQSLLSTMKNQAYAFSRRKKKPKWMDGRKLYRRVKKMNIHNRHISDQQQTYTWLTPKRIKAMGNHIQWMRNNHIGSHPVSQPLQKELLTVMPQLADYQYFLYRNRYTQYMQYREAQQQSNLEEVYTQLPVRLRNEIKEMKKEKIYHIPDYVNGIKRYIDQIHICLPEDERFRYQLLMTLAPKRTEPQKKTQSYDDQQLQI